MAVTAREQQVIDAYAAGLRVGQIAAQLGMHPTTVRGLVHQLCTGIGPDLAHERAMRQGSHALLAAIKRARAA